MPESKTSKTIDPVCGMEVESDSDYLATFRGYTYSFCSEDDKKEFQKHPKSYLRKWESGHGRPENKSEEK